MHINDIYIYRYIYTYIYIYIYIDTTGDISSPGTTHPGITAMLHPAFTDFITPFDSASDFLISCHV